MIETICAVAEFAFEILVGVLWERLLVSWLNRYRAEG